MPRRPATWRQVARQGDRIVLKAERKTPGRGVWLSEQPLDGTKTVERIAHCGHVVRTLTCSCDQHRHNVLVLAASYL